MDFLNVAAESAAVQQDTILASPTSTVTVPNFLTPLPHPSDSSQASSTTTTVALLASSQALVNNTQPIIVTPLPPDPQQLSPPQQPSQSQQPLSHGGPTRGHSGHRPQLTTLQQHHQQHSPRVTVPQQTVINSQELHTSPPQQASLSPGKI